MAVRGHIGTVKGPIALASPDAYSMTVSTSNSKAPPRREPSVPHPVRRWLAPSLVAVLAASLAARGWWTWPDVLIDFGRELYVAWRLAEGDVLYRDLAYFNGPFSPYLNSLWFRAFGTSHLTLALANTAVAGLIFGMIYWLFANLENRLTALVTALAGVILFGLAQFSQVGLFNFIGPYSHEMSHGIALSLILLTALWRWLSAFPAQEKGRAKAPLIIAGVALGLIFLTKPEFALAAACMSLTIWLLALLARIASPSTCLRAAAVMLAAAGIPIASAFVLFLKPLGFTGALHGVLGAWPHLFNDQVTSLALYQRISGFDDVPGNLRLMLRWTALESAIFGSLWIAAQAMKFRSAQAPANVWLEFIFATAGAVISASLLVIFYRQIAWQDIARPLPLIMLVLIVWSVANVWRCRVPLPSSGAPPPAQQNVRQWILRAGLAAFGLTLLPKILFWPRFFDHGFALAFPATLTFLAAITSWIPEEIDRHGGSQRIFLGAALGVCAVIFCSNLSTTYVIAGLKTARVGAGADTILGLPDPRVELTQVAVGDIEAMIPPGQTIAAVPEGAMLNYLTRRKNSTPYVVLTPLELILFDEDRIIDAFAAAPPDWIIAVHKDTSEYGFPFFGRDYAQALWNWIQANYETFHQIGPAPFHDDQFGVVFLRRREITAPADSPTHH